MALPASLHKLEVHHFNLPFQINEHGEGVCCTIGIEKEAIAVRTHGCPCWIYTQ